MFTSADAQLAANTVTGLTGRCRSVRKCLYGAVRSPTGCYYRPVMASAEEAETKTWEPH